MKGFMFWMLGLLMVMQAFAQGPVTGWLEVIGDPEVNEVCNDMAVRANGQWILAGQSNGHMIVGQDVIGEISETTSSCYGITIASDGTYLLAGDGSSGGGSGGYVVLESPNGFNVNYWEYENAGSFHKVIKTSDGGYLAVGANTWGNPYVVKFGPFGDDEWTYARNWSGLFYDVVEDEEGFYTAVGYEFYNPNRAIAVRLDESGAPYSVDWEGLYGAVAEEFRAIAVYDETTLAVCGNSGSSLVTVLLENDGDVVANGVWVWAPETGAAVSYDLAVTYDNGLAVAGTTGGKALVVKFEDDGDVAWSHIVEYDDNDQYATAIAEVNDGAFLIAGTYTEMADGQPVQTDMFTALVLDHPLNAPADVVITGDGPNDEVTLYWSLMRDASEYVVWSSLNSEGPYDLTIEGTTTGASLTVEATHNEKFYVVQAKLRSYDNIDLNYASSFSDSVGYVWYGLNGSGTECTYTTRPFGLAFKFWELVGGVPQHGTESHKPSSIIGPQLTQGPLVCADRVSRADNGQFAYRNEEGVWGGSLETNANMVADREYTFVNKTGSIEYVILAGSIFNESHGARTIPAPVPPATYTTTSYAWREARPRAIADLGLLEAGFTGGTIGNSDRIVQPIGGSFAYYRTSDNTWQGFSNLDVGDVYYIVNKHVGNTWTYTYTGE